MKKQKNKNLSRLKKDLDSVFSLYIRTRDQGQCFTCPTKKDIKEMQNGHYISRKHMNTRYDETNCNTQCLACNVFKSGNMPVYTLKLMEKYGDEIIKVLYQRSQLLRKFSRAEYETLIEEYKTKLSHL